jgi:hypothetical protein
MFFTRVLRDARLPYITGKGGRLENNHTPMQGLTWKTLKHHKALQPLFVIIGAGMLFVGAYIVRLASKTTDINWTKQKDLGDHMEYYADRQFKMFNPLGTKYEGASAERPRYRD